MIQNERQYRITQGQRRRLAEALDQLMVAHPELINEQGDPSEAGRELLVAQLEQASLGGQIADLDAQIEEYEQLRAGQLAVVPVSSIAELPKALVQARIANGLTQRELAERLGLKEQQIQRYEAEGYSSTSLSRLQEVMEALGVRLEAGLELPSRETPLARLRQRLMGFGLSRSVVDRRFLRGASEGSGQAVLAAAERAARLLGLRLDQMLGDDHALAELATTARFKAPRNAVQATLDAYVRYAEGVSDIVLRATEHLGPPTPPGSAQEVREAIEATASAIAHDFAARSDVLFEASLAYVWNLGIPVIPLRDSTAAFHGACFTQEERSVLVLKQTTSSPAQWLNDLLHELDHVRAPSRGEMRTWIELGEISEWTDAPEEQHAQNFAADVLFSGRAVEVLTQCLTVAGGSVERLKSVVPRVAEQAEVPVDVLANYLAYRLAPRGISWWPAATNMQRYGAPWRTAADMLLRHLDLSRLDTTDLAVLMDVLAE